jgi:hypothetical protein
VEGGREEEREEGVSAGVSAGGGEDGSEEEVRAEMREAEMAAGDRGEAEMAAGDRGEAEVAVAERGEAERGEEGQEWRERPGTKRVRVRVRRGGRVKSGLWWKSLAMVAGCGVIGWAGWRGGVNIGLFRGVKARELAAEAMKHQAADDEKKASELLERAVEFDGEDPGYCVRWWI